MNTPRRRPLVVGPLRAFEAVARNLNFRAAAEDLHLTQSAVSRQIQSLEQDVGAPLFTRGTRHVELTAAGSTLLSVVGPSLARLDAAVRQIRQARGRRAVGVTTFASFASLWLIPRLVTFQQEQPDIDVRISASDTLLASDAADGAEIDVALRYCRADQAGDGAERLFGEHLAPAACPWLIERSRSNGTPLARPADLAHHALLEADDPRPSAEYLSWSHWLRVQGLAELQPARWLYFNYTHQQVQAALAGQGVALARRALAADAFERGELVELFADLPGGRVTTPYAYWMVVPGSRTPRDEVQRFAAWVRAQAALTDGAMRAAV